MKKYNDNYPNGQRTYYHATKFALDGLMYAVKTQAAIRVEILLILIFIPLAIFLSSSYLEAVVLISPWFLLLIIELINTSIETVVDRVSLERHPLSKIAKDTSASAVFACVLFATLVWVIKLISLIDWAKI